jgi:hypothetical protein
MCVLVASVDTTAAVAQGASADDTSFEVGAFPGGGVVFAENTGGGEPDFSNYTFGLWFAWNAHRRIGFESEADFGIGGQKTVIVAGQLLAAQPMPDTAAYSENVIVSPLGNDRDFVPYIAAGIGALRLFQRPGTESLGLVQTRTFFAENGGAGLKWHAVHDWGARADYRLLVIAGEASAPNFFAHVGKRYGHRLYAGVFRNF